MVVAVIVLLVLLLVAYGSLGDACVDGGVYGVVVLVVLMMAVLVLVVLMIRAVTTRPKHPFLSWKAPYMVELWGH